MTTSSEPTIGPPMVRGSTAPVPSGPRSVWWVILACLALLFARKTDSFLNPQFWAEDGPVYFTTARIEGLASIVRPYEAPYVIHRVIAYAGSFVPVRYAPHFYTFSCLIITLAVLAYIAQARIDARYRGWMAIAAVCVPQTGEVLLFLNNIHWILALAMLVMAIARDPDSRAGKVFESVALFLMCVDGHFVFLFGPLFVIRALRWRTPYSFVLVGWIGVALLWQIGAFRFLVPVMGNVLLLSKVEHFPGQFSPRDPYWLGFWGNCLSGFLLLGKYLTELFPNSELMALLTLVIFGWLVAYGIRWGNWAYFGFLWGIFSVLAALTYMYRLQPLFATVSPGFRYSYVPYVCTTWILLFMIERRGTAAYWAAGLLVMIGISSLTHFHFPPLPDLHWAEKSSGIGGPAPCAVPINGLPAWRIYYDPRLEGRGKAHPAGQGGNPSPSESRKDDPPRRP